MSLSGIYAITDDRLLPGDRLRVAVMAALDGGISLLQYRSKAPDPAHRQRQAEDLLTCCQQYAVPLIINDDVDLALAIGAAGVHLGQRDGDPGSARRRLGPDALIGVSCHNSLELAIQAQEAGASYVAFGRFFPSRTKPDAPQADLSVLNTPRERLMLPKVAIGGVNPDNGAALIQAGADMLAVVNYLFDGPDVEARTRRLLALFD